MNKQQARELKAKTQRVETLVDRFEDDVSLLHDSSVDVTQEQDVAERQEEIQDELEQLTSDILALLDQSGEVDRADGAIPLPGPKRQPVEKASLPAPSNGNKPPWAGSSGNNGNGNSGN